MLRKLLFVSLFLFAGLVLPAAAQSAPQSYTSADGQVTLNYPQGWDITENRGTITILTAPNMTLSTDTPLAAGNAGFSLNVFTAGARSPLNRSFRGTTPVEKLQSFVDGIQGSTTTLGTVEAVTIGSHPAAQGSGEYTNSHNQVELMLVDFENGGYGFIIIVTAPNDLNRLQPKMQAIAESIVYTPPVSQTGGSAVNIDSLVPINQNNAGSLKSLSVISAHNGSATTVAISPDVQTIASGGTDGAILLWDAASGQPKPSPDTQSAGIQQLLFTPDGKYLISAGNDGTVRLWDAATVQPQMMQQKDGSIFYIAVNADSSDIAFISYVHTQTGIQSSTVWLWNLATDNTQLVEDMPSGFFANSLSFSPDGKQLLYSASDSNRVTIGLYDVSTATAVNHWSGRGSPIDVFFTADSTPLVSLASGAQSSDVTIWNPQTDNFEFTMSGQQATVYQTILNADRTIIGTPSFDGTTGLWDIQTGTLLGTLPHHAGVLGIAFSSDDRLLVTSDNNGFIYLWGIAANI